MISLPTLYISLQLLLCFIYRVGEIQKKIFYKPQIMLKNEEANDMNKSAWIIALDSMFVWQIRLLAKEIIIIYLRFVLRFSLQLDNIELGLMADAFLRGRFINSTPQLQDSFIKI